MICPVLHAIVMGADNNLQNSTELCIMRVITVLVISIAQRIEFCLTGPISLCLDSFVYCVSLYIVCTLSSYRGMDASL